VRVAVLNWRDIHHPHAGGAEIVSHEQAKGLVAHGHEVTFYAARFPGSSPEEWIDGYRVLRQGDRFGVYPRSAARLLRRARTERPDVVLEHVTGLPWYAPLWSPAPTVPYFHHVIGPTYFRELAPPLAAVGWCAERLAPSVYRGRPSLCPGAGSLRVFETLGYHASDFQLLPPGIQTQLYTPAGPKSAAPSMVLVGRIMRYKRFDLAIRALARLHPEMPELRLHVLGPDPAGIREELEALADRLGVGDVVLFHGRVPDETKRALLRCAWVNLVPSDQEGWGLTVMEAAACGTPSVGSDISGLSDVLVPGLTGATFRQGDAEDLARVLRSFLADEAARRQMGVDGRKFVETMTWESHITRLETVLDQVPGVPRGRPTPFPAADDRRALLR
jgi:glycosyltransferase involved in cell wall biosynthesis